MDLVEQIHIFGLTNIHTFGANVSLIRLFKLIFNYTKPQLIHQSRNITKNDYIVNCRAEYSLHYKCAHKT